MVFANSQIEVRPRWVRPPHRAYRIRRIWQDSLEFWASSLFCRRESGLLELDGQGGTEFQANGLRRSGEASRP